MIFCLSWCPKEPFLTWHRCFYYCADDLRAEFNHCHMVGSGAVEQLSFSAVLRSVQGHHRSCSVKSPPWYFRDFQTCSRKNVKKCKLWEVKNPHTKPVRKYGDTCTTVREIHCKVSGHQAFLETYMYHHKWYCQTGNGKCLEISKLGNENNLDSSHGTHFEHGLSPSWPSVVPCTLAFSFEWAELPAEDVAQLRWLKALSGNVV